MHSFCGVHVRIPLAAAETGAHHDQYVRTRSNRRGRIMSELFYRERFNTPTGWMLLLTDSQQRLRSLEWEDKGDRMNRLLEIHYGEEGYRLADSPTQSGARRAIEA